MQTYVYVGSSARTGGNMSGIFRRDIHEDHWVRLTNGLPDELHVHAIAVHPEDVSVLFAATSDGLYRGDAHGDRWKRLVQPAPGEQMWSVLIHPANHRTILTGTAPIGLYRSDDGGETWRRMPRPAIAERMVGAFPSRIMRLAVAPSRPHEIYAAMEVNGAMRSDDGGETWSDCTDPLVTLSQQPHLESAILTENKSEGMLDVHALCVPPTEPGTAILALRMGLFRSENRGETWQDLGIGQHADHLRYGRDIVTAPWNPDVIYACVSDAARGQAGRLYRSQDRGMRWTQFDHGIDVHSTMMAVALAHADPRQAHCVTRGGQTFSTTDGGHSWREYDLPEGCGAGVAMACG